MHICNQTPYVPYPPKSWNPVRVRTDRTTGRGFAAIDQRCDPGGTGDPV